FWLGTFINNLVLSTDTTKVLPIPLGLLPKQFKSVAKV
ncbi:hypothetical protein Golob_000652, partial [Gossypium lobatum]|nr:hypothetical protein [Gossypium lobatum]